MPVFQAMTRDAYTTIFVADEENSSELKIKENGNLFQQFIANFSQTSNLANNIKSDYTIFTKSSIPENPYLDYCTPPPNL